MNDSGNNSERGAEVGGRPWEGLLFLTAGLTAIGLSFLIHRPGVSSGFDPGPRMLPVLLGSILVAGGGCLWVRRAWVAQPIRADAAMVDAPEAHWHRGALIGGLAVYAAALSWAGFSLASIGFVGVWLILRGVRWWKSILVAVLLVVAARLLFERLFKVPLPAGIWT